MKISIRVTDVKNRVRNIQFERTFAHLKDKYMSSPKEAENCANAIVLSSVPSVLH